MLWNRAIVSTKSFIRFDINNTGSLLLLFPKFLCFFLAFSISRAIKVNSISYELNYYFSVQITFKFNFSSMIKYPVISSVIARKCKRKSRDNRVILVIICILFVHYYVNYITSSPLTTHSYIGQFYKLYDLLNCPIKL